MGETAMTVTEAMALLGCSKYRLAQMLGITRQAITKWGDDVPPARVAEIKALAARQ